MALIEVDGIAEPIDMGEDFDALPEDKQHELIDKKVAALRAKQKTSAGEKSSAENKLAALGGGAMIGMPAGYGIAALGKALPEGPTPREIDITKFKTPVEVAERAIAARGGAPAESKIAETLSRKVPGDPGTLNYARQMAAQQLPEKLVQTVEDMTTGKNPRGLGAGDVIARDIENLAKIKALGAGDFTLTGKGAGEIMVPGSEAQRRAAEAAIRNQQEVNAAAQLRAQRLAELKNTVIPGEKMLAAAGKTGQGLMDLTKSTIPRLAGHALSGAGAGFSAVDVADRLRRGEYGRAAISALGGAGDVATMSRHPLAMALGLPAGIGAPLVNLGLDAMLGRGELPVEKATGGLVALKKAKAKFKPKFKKK